MSVETGRTAEAHAAAYLAGQGFAILDRNWRNRWCELDIVARSSAGIHFVEVKYRRRTDWGAGYDYITPDKQRRLQRAALAWNQVHRYTGAYQIDVVSLSGELARPETEYMPNVVTLGW